MSPSAEPLTFSLRPRAPRRRSTADIAATYTPKSLTAAQWELARPAVVDAVVESGTTDSQATARLGALCSFLATTSAWDRASGPMLSAVVTQRHVHAWMTSQGTHSAHTQGTSQLMPLVRHLAGAQPHLRLHRDLAVRLGSLAAQPVPFVELNASLTAHIGHKVEGPTWRVGTATRGRTSTLLDAEVIGTLAERTIQEPSMPDIASSPSTQTKTVAGPKISRKAKPLSVAARKRAAKATRERKAALARAGVTRPVEEFDNSADVLEAIELYRPNQEALWDTIRPLTCYLTAAYQPPHARRAQSVMSAVSSFLRWYATSTYRQDRSAPLTLAELQRVDIADAYIVTRSDLSQDSRATHRSIIRRALRAGDNAPKAAVMAKRPVLGPCTPKECRTLLELAAGQPTESRTRQTLWLVALGLGAGLGAGDFRTLRRSDITTVAINDVSVLVVSVPGVRPRAVPVMAQFEEAVRDAMTMHDAVLTPDDYVLNGLEDRKQVLRSALRTLVTTAGDIPINQSRLRATWLFTAIHAPVPLTALLDCAGLVSARSLTELATYSTAHKVTSASTLALVAQQVQR